MCNDSIVVTSLDPEVPGSSPKWLPIFYEARSTAQTLPEPLSLRESTLGTRGAEHKGCTWGMQIDRWLQPRAVFGHTFSGISWHMPQKWSQLNCMTLSGRPHHELVSVTLHYTFGLDVRHAGLWLYLGLRDSDLTLGNCAAEDLIWLPKQNGDRPIVGSIPLRYVLTKY